MVCCRRLRPGFPVNLRVLLSAVAAGAVLQSSGLAGAEEGIQRAFRCESEEDLDGSACRVDMLPDAALAEMVYERGFDVEGADRLQLLDAVMQLLDYEYATGENLREMEYIPDDGSAAAAAETAAADLETAAANAAAAALAAEAEAAVSGGGAGSGGGAAGSGRGVMEESSDASMGFDAGGGSSGGEDEEAYGDDSGDQIAREVLEEASSSSTCPAPGRDAAGLDESSLLGYVYNLGSEVLGTIGRDMNSLVGMLPAPVAKPIREAASFVGDTATRFVGPGLKQAERYTRGLRRGAGKTAGKAALALKEEVLPRVGRGIKAAASKAKRRVEDALAARKERREDGGEKEQQQQQRGGRA